MSQSLSSLVDFVLVRPQFAGNTGVAARALKNAGFKKMILVKPYFSKTDPELKFAVGAKDLVQKAKVYEDLSEALSSYSYVIGTSRRKGAYRKNVLSLFELPSLLEKKAEFGKVAILFGTEADGLSNEEIALCQHLVYIPAHSKFESFNLGQAVLLVAYELFRSKLKLPKQKKSIYPTVKELEGMYDHLTQMLFEIGFIRKSLPDHMPRILRNIFNRAALTAVEVRIIRGICRQVLWYKKKVKSEE